MGGGGIEPLDKMTPINFSKKGLKMKLKNKLNFGGLTSTVIV